MGLKELRKARGVTVSQLEKEVGVSERTVRRWEKEGLGNASFKYVVNMIEALEVSFIDLLDCF